MTPFHAPLPQLLGWEALVFVSVLGFGAGALRILRLHNVDFGSTICAGLAAWLVLGGWLNLFGLATRAVLWVFVFAGCSLVVAMRQQLALRSRLAAAVEAVWPRSLAGRLLWCVLALFLGICCLSHVAETTWNKYDDTQGYLPFAEKALALGGLQPEPFSSRRLESGVGGATFLNEIMLAGPHTTLGIDFLDGCAGFVALLAVILAFARRLGLRREWLLPVLLWLGFSPFGRVNLTAVYFPAAMLLAAVILLGEGSEDGPPDREHLDPKAVSEPLGTARRAVLLGLLLGGAFTLKSTSLPVSLAWLGLLAVTGTIASRHLASIGGLLRAGLVSAAVMAPWALRHWLDEGTPLFPTLGKGFHLTAYPGFPAIAATTALPVSLVAAWPGFAFPLLAMMFAAPMLRGESPVLRRGLLCFFGAVGLTAPLLSVALSSEGIYRYLLPSENLCAVLLLTVTCAAFHQRKLAAADWKPGFQALIGSGVLLILWASVAVHCAVDQEFFREPLQAAFLVRPASAQNLRMRYEVLLEPGALAGNAARVQQAQAAVPAGAALLESVDAAYGFDWRRNPVALADYPGMASPLPGIPLDGTPDALRQYLLAHGIAYVVLDRSLFEQVDYAAYRRHPRVDRSVTQVANPWSDPLTAGYAVMEYTVSNRTREMLFALATPAHVLYDDGTLVVLKL